MTKGRTRTRVAAFGTDYVVRATPVEPPGRPQTVHFTFTFSGIEQTHVFKANYPCKVTASSSASMSGHLARTYYPIQNHSTDCTGQFHILLCFRNTVARFNHFLYFSSLQSWTRYSGYSLWLLLIRGCGIAWQSDP